MIRFCAGVEIKSQTGVEDVDHNARNQRFTTYGFLPFFTFFKFPANRSYIFILEDEPIPNDGNGVGSAEYKKRCKKNPKKISLIAVSTSLTSTSQTTRRDERPKHTQKNRITKKHTKTKVN